MNKSMVIGLVGGIGIATAGGVAGYAFLSQSPDQDRGSMAVVESSVEESPADTTLARQAEPVATENSAASAVAPAPRPAPTATQAAAPRPSQPAATPVTAAEPVVEQRCWDEEVTVQAEPKDDKAIAGTAAGAVLGGAIAKRLGDDNDLATAAGAAAGALAGRRIQRRVQDNNTTTVIERRCEPVR
jgi:uncharacterized protein YcfJ